MKIQTFQILRIVKIALVFSSLCSCFTPKGNSWIPSGTAPEDLVTIRRGDREVIITGCSTPTIGKPKGNGELQEYVVGKSVKFDKIFPNCTEESFPFSPTGICTLEKNGKQILYVNNGARKAVEIFDVTANGHLVHRPKCLDSELLGSPNGIAAFPDGTIYVSDFGFFSPRGDEMPFVPQEKPKKTENSIIAYLPPSSGSSCWNWRVVMTGFHGCNGVATGPDGKSLLVNSLHSKRIWSIRRDPTTGELSNPADLGLPLDFHPDNLKKTGATQYEASGQISKLGVALNLAFTWPVSPGGGITFDWDGKHLSGIKPRTHLLRKNHYGPSTTIKVQGNLYSGQPRCSGVFRTPAE